MSVSYAQLLPVTRRSAWQCPCFAWINAARFSNRSNGECFSSHSKNEDVKVSAAPFWSTHGQKELASWCDILPEKCDIAVIGGGLTGASVAFWLRKLGGTAAPSVCLFEQREFMSGATGRNGGHLHPFVMAIQAFEEKKGPAEAKARVEFENMTAKEMWDFMQEHEVTCDLRKNGTAMVSEDPIIACEVWEDSKEYYPEAQLWDAANCRARLGTDLYHSAVYLPASAQLWAAKFGLSVIREAAQLGARVFANTAIADVTHQANASLLRLVDGRAIQASKVVHATNGYIAELLPELDSVVRPCRGQILMTPPLPTLCAHNLVVLGRAPPGKGARYGSTEYLIQREDGRVIVGGMRQKARDGEVGEKDDSQVRCSISEGLQDFLERLFGRQVPVESEWSGIMGYTIADGMPLVGRLPHKLGSYIAAGFTGHGMPQCFGAGRSVAEIILCGSSPRLPNSFDPSRFFSAVACETEKK